MAPMSLTLAATAAVAAATAPGFLSKANVSCEMPVAAQEPGFLHSWCENVSASARFPACYPEGVPAWHPENNVIVQLPDPAACSISVSPEWTIAGWSFKYVQLGPGQSFNISDVTDEDQAFLKMIRGTVLDVSQIGVQNSEGHWETFVVTPPNTERSLQVDHRVKEVVAGAEGAVFAFMTVPVSLFDVPITDMSSAPTTTISGPHSELFNWTRFAGYYPSAFPSTLEFWNLAGILLQDHSGARLNYNQWWTSKQSDDVDGGYHNHADAVKNTSFGELHMVMYSAAPNTGMIVQLPNTEYTEVVQAPEPVPADETFYWDQRANKYVQLTIPLPPGYVHGPLWSINSSNGEPTTDCHDAIRYPYHGLVSGPINADGGFSAPARYTLWVVFEHAAETVKVPTSMLQYVVNAYLQNEVDWPTEACGEDANDPDGKSADMTPSASVRGVAEAWLLLFGLLSLGMSC